MGKLFLIPAPIGECEMSSIIPENVLTIVNTIKYYIVEDIRTARRYLIKLGINIPINDLVFFELNKHTKHEDISDFLKPIADNNIGLISEAGVPCVADPGSVIVKLAHNNNIQVVPLVGPSSIILALMASGMNGQNFAFVGYLPINKPEKIKKIQMLEKRAYSERQTQIFIETPYRNIQLLNDIISACKDSTLLCIATDLSLPTEFIKTKPITYWKKNIPDINKRPTIFLIADF